MDIRHIRYDGKITRVEYMLKRDGDESENKCTSRQKPEKAFEQALAEFVPLVLRFCGLEKAWKEGLEVTGVSFSESKAKGGRKRMGVIVVCRHQPEGAVSPLFFNTPLLKDALEDVEKNKPGFIPAAWDEAIEHVQDAAIRFVQGKRFQSDLPFAKAS